MAKFYGVIGYSEETIQISPGVWDDVIVERKYYGDLIREVMDARLSDEVLPDISISNSFSIIADAYAYEHFFAMKYIKWAGVYWTIRQVEVRSPRLLLRVGGVYNGPKA